MAKTTGAIPMLKIKYFATSGIKIQGHYKFAAFPGTDMYDGSNPLLVDMRLR